MKISDQKQRDTALDSKFSVHVESPAGAGKTGLLTARFMELLAMAEHPSQVLAMTFTRKAAAEMLKRIVGYLNDANNGKKFTDPYQAMLCDKAGRALKKHRQLAPQLLGGAFLRIMTIHSFCLEICRQAPVEAGLPPGLTLLEDREQKILQKESVVRTVTELLLRPDNDIARKALESRLLMHNLVIDNFIDEMIDLIARRDQLEDLFLAVSHGSHEELKQELEKGFRDIVENHLASLHSAMHDLELGRNWGGLMDFLKKEKAICCDLLPHKLPGNKWESIETWRDIAATLTTKRGTPRKSMGKKNGGFPENFSKREWGVRISEMGNELADMLHKTIELPLRDDIGQQTDLIFDLMLITLPVIRTYLTLCRAKGGMDYVDIEQAALRAMGRFGNNVTESILLWDKRLKHILIDEFQDTSFGQWNLIKSLVSGWEQGDGRTIFFVGDPKQSIYRFRKARVEIFYKAANGIKRDGMDPLPVTPIQLSINFRSNPTLIYWVNDLFGETVMRHIDKTSDDVRYNSASSPYPKDNKNPLYPECAVFSPTHDDNDKGLSSSELREKEADYLAFRVSECLKDLKKGETIGILLFTRTHLSTYLASLKGYGIYPRTKDGIKLIDNHEIAHIANLARALARPHDMLAWAACLRSLWLNIPVKQIYMIINSAGDTFFQRLKSYLDSGKNNNKSLHDFMDMVRSARARIGRDPLAKVLKKAWLSLCGASMIAAINGRQGVENITYFFDALEGAEAGSPEETLSMMEIILDDLYEPTDPGAASSPVEIMTVHGAKGLEFDYCFIPWMDYKPLKKNIRPAYLSAIINGRTVLVSRPDKRSGKDDFSYKCLIEIEKKRTLAEARRQFYVAATRAKKRLFLSGILAGRIAEGTPLAWLMNHLEYDIKQDSGDYTIRKDTIILNNPSHDLAPCNIKDKIEFKTYLKPEFNPEPLPYKIISPSGLRGQAHKTNIPGTENNAAAIRGTIIHQIFELISCNAHVPDKAWIENRLYANGLTQEDIADMAHEIADEVAGCRNDPFFQWLLNPGGAEWAASEWSIEGMTRDNGIYSGNIDRIIYDGKFYWIIDYKTNQKQKDENDKDFEQRMVKDYRSQLTAYAGMLKDLKECGADDIKKGIYLTSIHKWIEINN